MKETNQSNKLIFKGAVVFLLLVAFVSFASIKSENINTAQIQTIPESIIDIQKAIDYHENYKTRRVSVIKTFEEGISNKIDVPDGVSNIFKKFNPTIYVDFDYKELKKYLSYIESQANASNTNIETLRVYMGTHALTHPKYKNQNTVFMMPTMNKNGKTYGFCVEQINGQKKAVLVKDKINNSSPSSLKTSSRTISLIGNDGHSAPPPDYLDFN